MGEQPPSVEDLRESSFSALNATKLHRAPPDPLDQELISALP